MAGHVDLHLHTTHSDGSDAPERVVERALECELEAIAITDHDETSAIPLAQQRALGSALEVLPGTELSATFEGKELHIVGLGIDPESGALREPLDRMRRERDTRAERIVEKLQALGVPIELERLRETAGAGTIGRIHIGQEVMALGFGRTVQDVFDKYIKAGRPAYVPKENLPAAEAIDAIHGAGGLAFVAHPGLGDQHKRLESLITLPFDGIEAYHSRHTDRQTKSFLALAESRGLLVSGGSDCHGSIKGHPPLMGKTKVPRVVYDTIREALENLGTA